VEKPIQGETSAGKALSGKTGQNGERWRHMEALLQSSENHIPEEKPPWGERSGIGEGLESMGECCQSGYPGGWCKA